MYPILRPILNKGGAGHYISREESVERLNPLVQQHHELLQAYNHALDHADDDAIKARLDALMPRARAQVGKLAETVFSLGGTPPNGTDLEPGETGRGTTDAERLYHVLDLERAYHKAAAEEIDAVHHQERTRAILKVMRDGSDERLEVLREITNRLPRPADA